MSLNVEFGVNPQNRRMSNQANQTIGVNNPYNRTQPIGPGLRSSAAETTQPNQFMATMGPAAPPSDAGQNPLQQGSSGALVPTSGQSNWSSQTPGGLSGNINNQRYGSFTPGEPGNGAVNQFQAAPGSGRYRGSGSGIQRGNATQWNTDFGPVDTGVDNFRQFGDQYYQHTMGRLQPQMDQRNAQIAQSLINRGLQPGTEAYNAEMARMDSANNDMMSAAALGAEQLGLAAQNQAFGQNMANNQFGLQQANQNYSQQFGYDQLANAMAIAQQQAAASSANASAAAQASMYGADQQNYRAQLAHALGLGQLNEQGRQFDIGNITQNQLMDQNYSLGLMGALNDYRNTGINSYLAQQAGNQNWLGGINSLFQLAPGVNYTGTNTAGQMMQAGNNMANAAANQNQANNGLLGGLFGMFSDRRVKKNIEPVGQEHGINLYEFEYKDHMNIKGRYRGVMADEVRNDYPDAVGTVNGIDMVDYRQLTC